MRLVRPWTSVGRRKTVARAGIGVALVALLAVTGLLVLRRPSPAQLIVPGHMNDVTEVDPGYRYPPWFSVASRSVSTSQGESM